MIYKVKITETVVQYEDIEAESPEEAEAKAIDMYDGGELTFGPADVEAVVQTKLDDYLDRKID